jgi:hypothetical protein
VSDELAAFRRFCAALTLDNGRPSVATRPASFRRTARAADWQMGPRPHRHSGGLNHRPRVKREPLPRVLWLAEPRRLLGRIGPMVCGVTSDAPAELREAWR